MSNAQDCCPKYNLSFYQDAYWIAAWCFSAEFPLWMIFSSSAYQIHSCSVVLGQKPSGPPTDISRPKNFKP